MVFLGCCEVCSKHYRLATDKFLEEHITVSRLTKT